MMGWTHVVFLRGRSFARFTVYATKHVCKTKHLIFPTSLLYCMQPVKIDNSTDVETVKKLKGVDPATLSHSFLLENASACAADYAIILLNRTVHALLEVEKKYSQSMRQLTMLLEKNIEVLGDEEAEDQVWQLIIAARSNITQYQNAKKEMEQLMNAVERLILAASEASFLAGAEHSSFTLNNILSDSQIQLQRAQNISTEIQQKLNDMEIKIIEETSRHHAQLQEEKANNGTSVSDNKESSSTTESSTDDMNRDQSAT